MLRRLIAVRRDCDLNQPTQLVTCCATVHSPRRKSSAAVVSALAIVFLVVACVAQALFGHFANDLSGNAAGADDAYISYRYATNLYEHGELTFNLGDRVEGYSNLLYTLLMVPGLGLVGANAIYVWSVVLNMAATVSAVLLIVWFVSRRASPTLASAFAWTVALCPVLWLWTSAGLETPFVVLLQVLTWIAIEDDWSDQAFVWVAILSVLIRADGFLIPCLAAAYLWVAGRRRRALASIAATVVAFATLSIWRLAYYGQVLPNTYYAKVTGGLIERLTAAFHQFTQIAPDTGLVTAIILSIAAPGLTYFAARKLGPAPRVSWFPAVFTIANLGYWFYIGGDVFDERFLAVLFLFGAAAAVLAAADLRQPAIGYVCAAILIGGQLSALGHHQPRFKFNRARYDHRVELGRFLGAHHPGAVLAIDAAGKIPHFSGLTTIDMLGLNDQTIAHEPPARDFLVGHSKFDPDYIISRRPDLIATYVADRDLDLERGVTRAKYESNGYAIKYLVNAGYDSAPKNIVDISTISDERTLHELIERQGYFYIVLARTPPAHAWLMPNHDQPASRCQLDGGVLEQEC